MTTHKDEIVERLRRITAHGRKHGALFNADNEAWGYIDEALALIEQQASTIERVEEALAELADAARSACDARRHTYLIDALAEADALTNKER